MLGSPTSFDSVEAGVRFLKELATRKGRVFTNREGQRVSVGDELDTFLAAEVTHVIKLRASIFRQFGLLSGKAETK